MKEMQKEEKEDRLALKEKHELEPTTRDFEFGISADEAKRKLHQIKLFQVVIQDQLEEGLDYGIIPGTGKKPTLLKPGAEKIAKLLNCYDDYQELAAEERWDDKNPFFQYKFKCTFRDIATGLKISSGVGSCNSKEARYRYRWVPVWDLTEAQKAMKDEVPKKQRGAKKYWFYRFENDDIFSQVNTIMKQASKRSLISAALSAGRLSNIFSQDLEDTPVAKGPEEQAAEPITKEQTYMISRLENKLTDRYKLMPEVMQSQFRTEFGASKEIKDLTHPEAVEWISTLESRIDREEKKSNMAKENKDKKAAEKKEEEQEDLTPYKEELTFVLRQYHNFGGKDLTQKESDELDGAETLADYEALLKKWKARRDKIELEKEKAS